MPFQPWQLLVQRLLLFSPIQRDPVLAHLRGRLVREYTAHCNRKRNHQGIGNRPIEESRGGLPRDEPVRTQKRLGGLLRYYHREAA